MLRENCALKYERMQNRRQIARAAFEAFARSEFDSALEGDHARGAVAAEADAEQAGRWGDSALEGAEAGGDEAAGDAGLDRAGQGVVGVIEGVEHLRVESEGDAVAEGKLLGEVDVGVGEVGAALSVAAAVAELAVSDRVAAGAGSGGGIDDGDEGGGVQPLLGARLRDAGVGGLEVGGDAGDAAGELRSAALEDALAGSGVGLAEHGEG